MKVFLRLIIVLLLAVATFILFKPNKKKRQIPGTSFNYYPKANVYYDIDNKVYFLIVNEKWERSKDLTEQQKSLLGKQVIINNPAIPVWKENEQHRLVYGTALYTSKRDFKRKYYEDSINSLPKKVVVPTKDSEEREAEEKKRSGVRKFFDKIFRKKGDKK